MAINKNNKNGNDRIFRSILKNFWKVFIAGFLAIFLFFLFASWGLLVRCLRLKTRKSGF